jgi:hypothetical protein
MSKARGAEDDRLQCQKTVVGACKTAARVMNWVHKKDTFARHFESHLSSLNELSFLPRLLISRQGFSNFIPGRKSQTGSKC